MPITILTWKSLLPVRRARGSHIGAWLRQVMICLPLTVLVVPVAGCQPTLPPQGNRLPTVTFAHKAPIQITAEAVQKTVALPGELPPGDVSGQFSPNLRDAFNIWVDSRFVADGTPGVFEVQLVEAQLTRQVIADNKDGGLSGLFKDEQHWKYTGKMQVRIVRRLPGQVVPHSFVEAAAEGFFTTSQNITLNMLALEKFRLVESLITQIDEQAEESLHQYMGDIVN